MTVIRELKVKGASLAIKVDTKAQSICLVSGDDDIDGIGAVKLSSELVDKI